MHDVMGKFGISGVSAFYVVSGISFGYVYRELRAERGALAAFYTKRLFRIAPLYWIAMAGVLAVPVPSRLIGEPPAFPSPGAVALNLTLAFAFVAPAGSLLTGGWSIGNELYLLHPIVWTFTLVALWRVDVRSLALTAAIARPATLLGAWLVHRSLEAPMIRVDTGVAARVERGARGDRVHEHDAPRSDGRCAGHQSTQ